MKKLLSVLLAILMVASLLAGCDGKEPAADAAPATDPAAEPTTEQLASEPELKETVTVRMFPPFDWFEGNTYLWAWKDGGENAFAEQPGQLMEWEDDYLWCACTVPGWVDRLIFSNEDGTASTEEFPIEPGKDIWIVIFDDLTLDFFYEDPYEGIDFSDMESVSPYADEPIFQAAEQGDFETVKSLLPTLTDYTMLTEWEFNDFNSAYAAEAIMNGDYATAIEFYGYCAYDGDRQLAGLLQQLVDGDIEGACDTKMAMEFNSLENALDMTWPEIVCMVTGVEADPEDTNYILMEKYLTRRMWNNQPTFSEDALVFGDFSAWTSEGYITKLVGGDDYIMVDSLDSLTKQCGSEPNGKVLILRGQKDYDSGKTYYAIDLLTMEYLSYDLYPSSLSEVEYIILADYSYEKDGKYQQTFTMGDSSDVSYFTFLRMKGRVTLMDASGDTIEKSDWIKGTGEPEAQFSDLDYQCSNMPETGAYIKEFVEQIRQQNAEG